jgi:alkanesulfonate monooxygenase SsuD/methylene tetrahydromethanopterin reductase-like flavin-dependent oxidoreductase (luciferase family)
MREYVHAVRAVWDNWQNGTPLDVKGPHYNINLMVPALQSRPIEHPHIPIQIAAVNAVMCQVSGKWPMASALTRSARRPTSRR